MHNIGTESFHISMNSKSSQVYLQQHSSCCEPVLQSSTGQWGMHFALSSAAVQWCWVTAHLYEEEIFTGVFAATQFML